MFYQPRDTEPVSTPRIIAPGIELRRAEQRFLTRTDWSETQHSFSFGEHYDPSNVSFGQLLVNNDDLVRAGSGYADHPHRDTEIITWVLSGSLVHQDSRGNSGLIYPGLAQRMSAGSGIVHSERNDAYLIDPARATSSASWRWAILPSVGCRSPPAVTPTPW